MKKVIIAAMLLAAGTVHAGKEVLLKDKGGYSIAIFPDTLKQSYGVGEVWIEILHNNPKEWRDFAPEQRGFWKFNCRDNAFTVVSEIDYDQFGGVIKRSSYDAPYTNPVPDSNAWVVMKRVCKQ